MKSRGVDEDVCWDCERYIMKLFTNLFDDYKFMTAACWWTEQLC